MNDARTWLVALLLAGSMPAALGQQSMSRQQREEAAEVNTQLAITYLQQGDLATAREKIDRALDQHAKTPQTQMWAGVIYDRLGEVRKAQSHFDQAVKLSGRDSPDVLNAAGAFHCIKGDRKRGEELFLQAAGSPLYRTPEVAYLNAGNCARADGRPEDADRYLRKVVAIRPNMPEPLLLLADLQFASDNALQARAFLQRYHEVAPAGASSLWLGYRIERALGDRAVAEDFGRRLKAEFPTSVEAGELFQAERAPQ